MRKQARSFLTLLGILGALAGALSTVASAAAHPHQQLINQVLARIAPGDRGRILHDTTLQITIPDGLGNPRRADVTPAWRAGLAGQELALRIPGLRQMTIPGNSTDVYGDVRHPVGVTDLDGLSVSAARQQLAANLRVLARGIPTSADLQVHSVLIPMALSHRRFAFAVTITVRNLDALHPYYGDLALGPGTGLTGRDEPIEGLAVSVHDRRGNSLGAWSDVRGQEGAVDYGPGDGCLTITLPFADRNGNPPAGACHG